MLEFMACMDRSCQSIHTGVGQNYGNVFIILQAQLSTNCFTVVIAMPLYYDILCNII